MCATKEEEKGRRLMGQLSCPLGALLRMIGGKGGAPSLWPSLSEAAGTTATSDKATGPEKRWLKTFLGSGARIATELRA